MFKNQKGFTLVELVFVMAWLSMVFGVGYVIVHFISKFW